MSRHAAAAVFLVGLAPFVAARAAQQLIPSPYPETLGGTAILPESAPPTSRHQHLIPVHRT